ncbi:hypothetical protein D3C87_1446600 [compost metagenome]
MALTIRVKTVATTVTKTEFFRKVRKLNWVKGSVKFCVAIVSFWTGDISRVSTLTGGPGLAGSTICALMPTRRTMAISRSMPSMVTVQRLSGLS